MAKLTQTQRNHISDRLYQIYSEKQNRLLQKYRVKRGVINIAEELKAGRFTLKPDFEKGTGYHCGYSL